MSTTLTDKSPQRSSKVLCVVYGLIAAAALVATWTQNTAYLHAGIGRFFIGAESRPPRQAYRDAR